MMVSLTFRVNAENAKITEVVKGLFVSGICALTPATIHDNRITLIVNTTQEVPNVKTLGGVQTIKLWIEDNNQCDIYAHLEMVTEQIHAVLSSGGRILIHSVHGVSRCATLCLAYLTKYRCRSLKDAYTLLAAKRPQVTPNIGFWRQLIAFEQEVKQSLGSVNIIRDPREPKKLVPDVYAKCAPATSGARHHGKKATGCLSRTIEKKVAEGYKRLGGRLMKCRQIPSAGFHPVLEPINEKTELIVPI